MRHIITSICAKKTADDHYLIKSDLFPWSDGGWEKLKLKK
jgi:hypothetical protein